MVLLDFFRKLRKRFTRYETSIEVLVNAKNLLHNLAEYQRAYPNLLFAPVLKSNAYGHGLAVIARILDNASLPFFVVDSLYEALTLRRAGIRTKILVIGFVSARNIERAHARDVSFAIVGMEHLQDIARTVQRPVAFHLKLDTGMHRQGIMPNQLSQALDTVCANRFLKLEGVCSHFADADGPEEAFTQAQIEEWEQAVETTKQAFPDIAYFHLANTAGTFYARRAQCNVARLGAGLYGVNSSPFTKLNLKLVLQMNSLISSVRTVPAGESVGYNATYTAQKDTRVATVPVGYFEGVDRRLSDKGYFKIGSVFCPIVGKVSMNITSVDVSAVPHARMGDAVNVISNVAEDKNSIVNIAKTTDAIAWEILVHVSQHLRRTVVDA